MSFKKIVSLIGIDKAIIFTSSSSIIGAFGSIVSVLLVVKYLTGVEQGFYYTFGSIVTIQVFFELGLNGIITQYVAHEVSNLKWVNENLLTGESKYLSRIASLLHFSLKWYVFFAGFLLISLVLIGFIFFHRYDTTNGSVIWKVPWILLSLSTAINLILSPLMAFIQGLGKVKEIAKIQLVQQIFRLTSIWLGLILGAKLFVLGIGSFIGVVLCLIIILIKYKNLLIKIWETAIVEKVNYYIEIFPYQWKIALSWISSFFIFQLFNPVLFATEGALVAGQMGMTLAALNGIQSLSYAWITTKVPVFSGLIAQKKYSQLDAVFTTSLKQSAFINLGALILIGFVIFLIRQYNIEISGKPLGDRFLGYIPMIFLMIPVFLNQFVSSWGTYLRCHKKEPYLVTSITLGILCSLSTIYLSKYYGVIGVTSGYCFIVMLVFPWAFYIYKSKREEWHN